MKPGRLLLGLAMIVHGLAHASAGTWATDIGGRDLVTALWEFSALGYVAAGGGVLGVTLLHRHWRVLVVVATVSSLLLLGIFGHPLFLFGIVADILILAVAVFSWWDEETIEPVEMLPRLAQRLFLVFILYVGIVIGLRPWYTSWGATRSEQQMVMIGDPPLGQSHYRIDHAITIHAPVDSVWPWLADMGRGSVACRVTQIEPGRALVLGQCGALVLTPVDARTTRMHVRKRGSGVPTLSGIALTPLQLLVFEPAHFIMERAMLLGIKRRAERSGTPYTSRLFSPGKVPD
ncbi:MAG: hypothetical protein ACRD3J_07575 [Thermoanaerobaculia bacterium]